MLMLQGGGGQTNGEFCFFQFFQHINFFSVPCIFSCLTIKSKIQANFALKGWKMDEKYSTFRENVQK